MEKTLQWIVPVANNTSRAHHGFGWVGEWANTGNDLSRTQAAGQPDALKIETLYHADKEKTDACILDLVVWLHILISYSRPETRSPSRSPVRSPVHAVPAAVAAASSQGVAAAGGLTREDREMLQDAYIRRRSPVAGKSKSQELSTAAGRGHRLALSRNDRLSKSGSHCPSPREHGGGGRVFPLATGRSSASPSPVAVVGFDIDRIRALDVMDRVQP